MDDSKPSPVLDGDDAKKRKVKPVLKKHHVEGEGSAECERKKKEIKWDEEIIEEHDQLRGSRQKVCYDRHNYCPAESSGHCMAVKGTAHDESREHGKNATLETNPSSPFNECLLMLLTSFLSLAVSLLISVLD
jgi:hypothetical protein